MKSPIIVVHSAYAGCERIALAYKFVNDGGKQNTVKDEQDT